MRYIVAILMITVLPIQGFSQLGILGAIGEIYDQALEEKKFMAEMAKLTKIIDTGVRTYKTVENSIEFAKKVADDAKSLTDFEKYSNGALSDLVKSQWERYYNSVDPYYDFYGEYMRGTRKYRDATGKIDQIQLAIYGTQDATNYIKDRKAHYTRFFERRARLSREITLLEEEITKYNNLITTRQMILNFKGSEESSGSDFGSGGLFGQLRNSDAYSNYESPFGDGLNLSFGNEMSREERERYKAEIIEYTKLRDEAMERKRMLMARFDGFAEREGSVDAAWHMVRRDAYGTAQIFHSWFGNKRKGDQEYLSRF